jgi:hypothetical protein
VDRSFFGEPRPYQASLSDVRVIMVVMRVLVVMWLCQAVMGWIPALERLLPGVHGICGYVSNCLALNGLATQGSRLLGHLPGTGNPQVWLPRAQTRVELGHKEELDRADRWQNPGRPLSLSGDKRTGADRARFSSFKLVVRLLQP